MVDGHVGRRVGVELKWRDAVAAVEPDHDHDAGLRAQSTGPPGKFKCRVAEYR